MKMRYFVATFLMMAATAQADVFPINKFSGINTDDSSLALQNGQTPDSQNVVTDDGFGLSGRKGFVGFSTEPSRGLWSFGKSDGSRFMITVSSNIMKAATSTTFSIQVATVTTLVPTYATSLGDKFFFVNTVDGLKAWDGSTIIFTSATFLADKITTFKGRVAIGDVTGNARVLYLSKYLDGTTYVAPVNPSDDDATQITVNGVLDEGMEGLYPFQDKLIIFKPSSFSGLYGSRRSNFSLRTFSDSVGLSGTESVQDCDGKLRWLSRGRREYEFDGATFHKTSEPVDKLFATISQGDSASRSWLQTTQADFSPGYCTPEVYCDTQTTPGNVQLTFPDLFDTLRDDALRGKKVWAGHTDGIAGGGVSVSSGDLIMSNSGGTTGIVEEYTYLPLESFTPGTTYNIRLVSMPYSTDFSDQFLFELSSSPSSSSGNPGGYYNNSFWRFQFNCDASNQASIVAASNDKGDSIFTATSTQMPFNFTLYLTTTTYQYSINTGAGPVSIKSGTHTWPGNKVYAYLLYVRRSSGQGLIHLDNFNVAVQTITYLSQVHNDLSVGSWGIFNADVTNNFGTNTFYIRSSTNSIPVSSSTPTWTAITPGNIPSISTGTYFQVRDDIAENRINDVVPMLNDFIVNWNDGSSVPAASGYINQRYWLSVQVSSTANNRIFVYDKQNQWQVYSNINASAMTIHKSKLYFGNSLGIFEAENGLTDNGNSITSYFQTNTFSPSGFNYWSQLEKLFITTENSDATLSTSYQMNGIPTDYSLGSSAMSVTPGIQDLNLPFSMGETQQGKLFSLKWTVTGSSFWRILNGNLYFIAGHETD